MGIDFSELALHGAGPARTRAPFGPAQLPRQLVEPDEIVPYLSDEAHFPGGRCDGVFLPRTEGEAAAAIRASGSVLPVGARSSLTGGATPIGGSVLALERLDAIALVERAGGARACVRAGAGVTLTALGQWLEPRGLWYPPVPTFTGAMVGGVVATNAAGAATFKYGSTREWVAGLTVVLASGEVLELNRGECVAGADGYLDLVTIQGPIRIPVPGYSMPVVAKRSAGYHAACGMDLIDLFIGAEGTLGVVTEARLYVEPLPGASLTALVLLDSEALALDLSRRLREEAFDHRRSRGERGIDVAALEFMDRRCLEILREDGEDRRLGVPIGPGDGAAIVLQAELPALPPGAAADEWMREVADFQDADVRVTPVMRLCRILEEMNVLDRVQMALPGDAARAAQLFALREAVPAGVNRRVGEAKRRVDPEIQKVAADMIVPFERLGEATEVYRGGFGRRGLDYAIWGHISDGNLHPNVLPRTLADVKSGKSAVLEFGREIARLGGCPLSEHGVGRNPVKQELLRQLYGDEGIEAMRAVKRLLDPLWKLAPGVLFSRSG